jgi:hypothetical protein
MDDKNQKIFTVTLPGDMCADASAMNKRVWERRIGEFVKCNNRLTANI